MEFIETFYHCVLLKSYSIFFLQNLSFFFFCLFVFLGPHLQHMEVPRLRGSNWSCSCWPMPEPQQRGIRAASATYTPAHSNTGSLTHWARPGIESATSRFLVGFVDHWAMTGTPKPILFWLPSYHLQLTKTVLHTLENWLLSDYWCYHITSQVM